MAADSTLYDGASGHDQVTGRNPDPQDHPSADPNTRAGSRSTDRSTNDSQNSAALHRGVTIGNQPQPRIRRNPKWIALGILAICLGGLGSFFLYSHLSDAHQVIALTKTVHRGEEITPTDLTTVQVTDTGGVPTVPSDRMSSMIGQVAGYDLVKGSLLSPASVGSSRPPAAGKGVIGIKVSQGRAPNGYLEPNTPVQLVVLPARGAAAPKGDASHSSAPTSKASSNPDTSSAGDSDGEDATSLPVIPAKVLNTSQVDGGLLLNVEMKSKQAVRAASYAARDRIAVVRDSEH